MAAEQGLRGERTDDRADPAVATREEAGREHAARAVIPNVRASQPWPTVAATPASGNQDQRRAWAVVNASSPAPSPVQNASAIGLPVGEASESAATTAEAATIAASRPGGVSPVASGGAASGISARGP